MKTEMDKLKATLEEATNKFAGGVIIRALTDLQKRVEALERERDDGEPARIQARGGQSQ